MNPDWETSELVLARNNFRGSSFAAGVGRLASNVTVYYLWLERNNWIFVVLKRLSVMLLLKCGRKGGGL